MFNTVLRQSRVKCKFSHKRPVKRTKPQSRQRPWWLIPQSIGLGIYANFLLSLHLPFSTKCLRTFKIPSVHTSIRVLQSNCALYMHFTPETTKTKRLRLGLSKLSTIDWLHSTFLIKNCYLAWWSIFPPGKSKCRILMNPSLNRSEISHTWTFLLANTFESKNSICRKNRIKIL